MSTPTPTPPGSGQPLRSALKTDDDVNGPASSSASTKAVQIAEPESMNREETPPIRQFPANLAKRLSGRPAISPANSSRTSLASRRSVEDLAAGSYFTSSPSQVAEDQQPPPAHHRQRLDHASQKLVAQVADWLQHERTKREHRKPRKHHHLRRKSKSPPSEAKDSEEAPESVVGLHRAASSASDSSDVSLERLQRILDDGMAALGLNSVPRFPPKLAHRSSGRLRKHHHRSSLQLSRTASSDTEYYDGDVLVPSCDAVLDNSKTMKYGGGQGGLDEAASISSRREEKERQAWITFKNEIIRLAHTLRLKGWRRVPLDSGESIHVERLSGALTNAVYVVSPPENLPSDHDGKKTPTKVLLRVYGPQVEQLIDRENELSVLRRLARKKIGPRLLGTFQNGRFEQFFNATTLTWANLREPETSKQIAKRMRELHEGVELLEEERNEGPGVWKNWDHWLHNVEQRILYLDRQILEELDDSSHGPEDAWKKNGFICGVEWHRFRATVERYRQFLNEYYGSPAKIRERLVFAHNDTQYGNILRIRPDDEKSPLLQPSNQHKQLVVIDFEYASANVPGLEFANHFTEWTYNYHDPLAPYACNTDVYPTPEQQHRFIKAYVEHRPQFPHSDSTPSLTPLGTPTPTAPGGTPALHTANSSSSIVDFMLDARVPPGGWKEEERRQQEQVEARVRELAEETRLWRIANSAQWVAWGIVQAKVPGLREAADAGELSDAGVSDAGDLVPNGGGGGTGEVDDPGFDYLQYAQQRALFFWGDCVKMGVVKREELPGDLVSRIKIVKE
ncbi:Choline kinase [Pleurostoma richardsiae]|uniref:Choline kinase n=1 Tax=Pleurostoma richardsiae TaxID=41990 RepID=A0AA38RRB3_9PEZI|nr:Choline kinase [Pleurostoma richardsiae]